MLDRQLPLSALAVLVQFVAFATADIRLPQKAMNSERTAAGELRDHLARLVRGTLSVGGESNVVFHVGATGFAVEKGIDVPALEDERWIVRSYGRDVVLAGGGRRGTLYAVAHFLEDCCGVRWWSETEELVPTHDDLSLPALDLSGRPAFRERDIYSPSKHPLRKSIRLAVLNRINGSASGGSGTIPGEWGGVGSAIGGPAMHHTFARYVPPKEFGKAHPEWFSYNPVTKKRATDANGQLCFANGELRAHMKRRLAEFIEADRKMYGADNPPVVYDISHNDNENFCACPDCEALKAKYGVSGYLLDFINDIAASVAGKYPYVLVRTFAYGPTEALPRGGVRPADNVLIRLCDTRSNQAVSILHPDNRFFREQLEGWGSIARHVGIWDYDITFTHDLTGFPYASEFQYGDLFRLSRKNHVEGFFWEHENPARADCWVLKRFVEARLMEDPALDNRRLVAEFCRDYYGRKAGKLVFHYREDLNRTCHARKGNIFWFPSVDMWDFVTPEKITEWNGILDEAEKAVRDDAVLFARVRQVRQGLDRLTSFRHLVRDGGTPPPEVEAARRRLRETWAAWMREHGLLSENEIRREIDSACGRPVPPEFAGRRVRDFTATVFSEADPGVMAVWNDPESKVGSAMRVDAGRSKLFLPPFDCGIYDAAGHRKISSKSFDNSKSDGKYHWIYVGTGTVTSNTCVWFTRSWSLNLSLKRNCELYGRTYDVWASVKFTGPTFGNDRSESDFIWLDRVILAEPEATVDRPVGKAWERILKEFRSERTGLVYEYCHDGDSTRYLPTPEEIAKNFPVATGWNTGMEDSVLTGGPLLLAAMARNDEKAFKALYPGFLRCATISGKPGFLARSISPADGRSFYWDSSRDQYTLFVYTMWRIAGSGFATPAMKDEIKRVLRDVATYAESCMRPEHDFTLLRYDGKPGLVGKLWLSDPTAEARDPGNGQPCFEGLMPHETQRLPMIYAAAHALTGDAHWRELELSCADDALRMAETPEAEGVKTFSLFQKQISLRLLWECETDPSRKLRYLRLMRSTADRLSTVSRKRCDELREELGGDLAAEVGDWRTWERKPEWRGPVFNGLPSCVPVRPERFQKAYDCLREAGEALAMKLLCPDVVVTADEREWFESFVRTSGFERNNSSGIAYVLLAQALLAGQE